MNNINFPCPFCKGQGGKQEDPPDAYGPGGPWYDCGICDGYGIISIDGLYHQRIKRFKNGK